MKYFILLVFIGSLCSCNVHNSVNENNEIAKMYDSLGIKGSFGLLNNVNGIVTLANKEMFVQRYSPASTAKILVSLIALQEGTLASDSTIVKWDGIKRRPEWDKDMNLIEALKTSNQPFFNEIANKIGRNTLQLWMDSIGYGNKNINGDIGSFWINDSLKISCDEQLAFIKKIYFNQLPFNNRSTDKVKNILLQETDSVNNITLSYKTGWNPLPNENLGWLLGYAVKDKQPYFFVQLLKSPDSNFKYITENGDLRLQLAKKSLKMLGILPK